MEEGADLAKQDSHGRTALDLCPPEFLNEFLSIDFSEKALMQNHYALWFHLIIVEERETFSIAAILQKLVLKYSFLAEAKDSLGRQALNVATPSNVRAINSVLLIHGRYLFLYTPILFSRL